jgi:hypothetical protein
MTTNTISFVQANKTICRQAGFADFSTGMRLECDASLNSGVFTILTTAGTALTVAEAIVNQASGANITLSGRLMQNIGKITAFNGFSLNANVIDVTSLGSTAKEKFIGLVGGGDISLSLIFENEASGTYLHDALIRDMTARTKRVFDICFTDTASAGSQQPSFAYFEGYVQSYTLTGAVDNVLRADMTITISTGIDWQNAT